ncbi:MAG: hypothetical protein IJ341_02695 [Bacteroidales bacterium]|nr:hypothetical protein [Bacteroidales bacterium]
MADIHLIAHINIDEDVAKEFIKNQGKESYLSFENPLEYFRDEFGWLNESGIFLRDYSKIDSSNELRIRNISANICSLFEDVLDVHNLTVPDSERAGDESEARLYGETYSDLEDSITTILLDLCKKLRETPNAVINTKEY